MDDSSDFSPVVPVPTASLHGKVAIVTGAGRGIGRAIALELGKRGCSVMLNYRSSGMAADETCREIKGFENGAQAHSLRADVTQVAEIDNLFTITRGMFGRIDIVVSNSGMEAWDETEQITEQRFDEVFGVNAKAQFFVGQAALKYGYPNGRMVMMSSIAAGLLGVKDHALYNASKMAVIGMVKSFATDFAAKKGITVNGIAPGGVKSDMFEKNAWRYIPGAERRWDKEKIESAAAQNCPLGRCAEPEDVAKVVAFLCSEDAGWVNGQVITISGGASQ